MDKLINITEFVVVSNLENRALNAGINKAQNWWKNRHNDNAPIRVNQGASPRRMETPVQVAPPRVIETPGQFASPRIMELPGQLTITILLAQDLHESLLSAFAASAPIAERPYVVIECNQQRFQTIQADSNSTNRNPQWTSGNGPFNFKISNADVDHLTVWIQQQESLRVLKRNEPKMLGMCEINVKRLIDQEQVWLPLRKDNKPAGQVLLKVVFIPRETQPRSYNRIL